MKSRSRFAKRFQTGHKKRWPVPRSLWPRGLTKSSLKLAGWMKDVAPDDRLRRWFNHDPDRWDEFRKRYFDQLDGKPNAWKPLAEAAAKNPVTLVYGARDVEHNNAVALAEYLKAQSLRVHHGR